MVMALPMVVAGLMGAAGVVLAAIAAHSAPGAGLDSASQMLLIHALAVLCTIALMVSGRLWRAAALLAMVGWITGGALFAGDIALKALAGHRLFPMAAPTGGMLLIASWLVISVAAAVGRK
ncbi:MAG: DUF423 domain-containing protein [Hyphomicrobiaceae bacterium]